MKPPPRKRSKPDRHLNPEPGPPARCLGSQWQRAEQRNLLKALKKLSKINRGQGDLDCDFLKKYVPTRSTSEILSVVDYLKDKVISLASSQLNKNRQEEKKYRKPIQAWTNMARAIAGDLEESISTAFSQMLIVSSTEPCTLKNCDPPQIYRPANDKPVGRTVPFRPMPRIAVKVEDPGTNTTPAPASSPTPTGLPASSPTPTGLPASSPTPPRLPASSPTPTRLPASSPTPTRLPASSPTLTGLPASSPTLTGLPASSPTPTRLPASSPTPTRLPASSPTPTGLPASSPTPTRLLASSPTPTGLLASSPTPTGLLASSPTPTGLPASSPTPRLPASSPTPTRLPASSPTPTGLPASSPTPRLPASSPTPTRLPASSPTPTGLPASSPTPRLPASSPTPTRLPASSPTPTGLPASSPTPRLPALPATISPTPHTPLSSSDAGQTPSAARCSSSSSTTPSPPLSCSAADLHTRFGRTSKYATKDSPRTFGVKSVVDFERIYRYLSTIHQPSEECHLTPMESAIILDLLMSLPEELRLLDSKKLQRHLIQVYQCLSTTADSKTAQEMFKELKHGLYDGGTRSEGKKQQQDSESQSTESNNISGQSGDTDAMGSCPPLNPFIVPLRLLKRK